MLHLRDATVSVAGRDLLVGADWSVHPGETVGLVGRNGTGKSTLLRVLAGEHFVDHGRIEAPPSLTLGYLHQHLRVDGSRSCWEEARSGMTRLLALEADVARTQAAVEAGAPGAVERLVEQTEHFRMAGGFSMDERVGEVLHGLGFSRERWEQPVGALSGGWKVRVALARMLLGEPDLLLLDEPTNHLDVVARGWLARFLAASKGAVILVSHDRHLLDVACSRVTEIRDRTLHHFRGGFSAWRRQRGERLAHQLAAYEAQQQEIARLERFVVRFKNKPTKAAQAMSRLKQLEKIERIERPQSESEAVLRLSPPPESSAELLALDDASLGYDGTPVVQSVGLRIERGMRLALLGLNGAGKSTVLKALAGTLSPLEGRRRTGRGLKLGVLTQDLARELPADATPLEVVRDLSPLSTDTALRSALGALGLRGDFALRPCGTLSGGEKARVVLAGFAARPLNALLLDEPTNHLDVGTVDVLVDALRAYPGALLVVTHDRHLVEQVATHVALVKDGKLVLHEGVLASDFELELPARGATAPSSGAEDWAAQKARKRERARLERRLAALEDAVTEAEAAVDALDRQLVEAGADVEALTRLAQERSAAAARAEALVEQWGALEEALN